jgi:hypothetical protein
MAKPSEIKTKDFGHDPAKEQEETKQATDIDLEKQTPDDARFAPITSNENPTSLERTSSHVSTQDIAIHQVVSYREFGDEVYDRLSLKRKHYIVAILSLCAFLAPISSTTVLAATPEVAATFNTTGTIINLSNAVYMIFMGLSPVFWGPLGQVYGRRWVSRSKRRDPPIVI